MNPEVLLAQLRADLEADGPGDISDPRLGRMIATAARTGRRRRAAGGLLVAAATVVAVSALMWPVLTFTERLAEPAAPPTASTPVASSRPDPRPLPATGPDVVATLSGLLPPTFAVSHASSSVLPQGYEMHVGLTVTDDAGSAWVGAGISADEALPCVDPTCSTTVVDGVVLTVRKHVTNAKACDFTRYDYDRPDGGSVWFGQVSTSGRSSSGHDLSQDCDRRPTRPQLPLSDQEIKDLLTSRAWDSLFPR